MAQSANLDSSQRSFKGLFLSFVFVNSVSLVVVLMEVDQLTRDAQHALRRTMEKYSGNCRLMLCCESLSRVIEPLQSRCVAIRVPAPTSDDVRATVVEVCRKEGVQLPEPVLKDLIEKANGNMRRAILMAETAKVQAQNGVVQSTQKVNRDLIIYTFL